ncbi:MAG: hypothetical protein ABIX28_13675 [Vicinamibacterales bacterium]
MTAPVLPGGKVGSHRRLRVCQRGLLAFALALLVGACSSERAPVRMEGDIVVVENHTPQEWRQVVITVNDHFRGGSPTLAPGGRLTAPLSGFQTAFGQRFERARQSVTKIDVTAVNAAGAAVALTWAGDRAK